VLQVEYRLTPPTCVTVGKSCTAKNIPISNFRSLSVHKNCCRTYIHLKCTNSYQMRGNSCRFRTIILIYLPVRSFNSASFSTARTHQHYLPEEPNNQGDQCEECIHTACFSPSFHNHDANIRLPNMQLLFPHQVLSKRSIWVAGCCGLILNHFIFKSILNNCSESAAINASKIFGLILLSLFFHNNPFLR
jgi:hypothetical protein